MSNEVPFKEEEETKENEPLKMEHFYFPLGMWLGGLILSTIFLLAEIIIHRIRKSKRDVPMLTLEEPSVTHSTVEFEVEHNYVEDTKDTL